MTTRPVPETMADGKWEWDRCVRAVHAEGMPQTLSCRDVFASVLEGRRVRAEGVAREGEREGRREGGKCWRVCWGGGREREESLLGTVT